MTQDTLRAQLLHKIDQKTKPRGALGQLETLALQIGLIQNTLTPQLTKPHLIVFAGDHGAARAGVSLFPQEVTWQMVFNFLQGGAAFNVFTRQNGIEPLVVDAGVNHDFANAPGMIHAKVGPGTRNYMEEPAMTAEECRQAMDHGRTLIEDLVREGCNVVGFGEMGIGNTASSSLITHALTGVPLPACVGRGTGLDDEGVERKRMLLTRAVQRWQASGASTRPGPQCDALEVLREFGGFEMAMMVGAYLAAAERRVTVLVDGFITTASLLVAARLQPSVLEVCIFSHRSGEAGHQIQLDALGCQRPLLDLGLRLGEGTGAALAYPIVEAAVNFLNQMASFESAGVSDSE